MGPVTLYTLGRGDRPIEAFLEILRSAASQLLKLASQSPTVMMCAEKSPEECHRRLLADYLLLQGAAVIHLLGNGEQREHVLYPQARRASAALIYDAGVSAQLPLGDSD